MEFTKAIILSETDFRCLIDDILDNLLEADNDEYDYESTIDDVIKNADRIAVDMWEYLVEQQDDVDCLIVYIDGRSREIYSEDDLSSLIEGYYE